MYWWLFTIRYNWVKKGFTLYSRSSSVITKKYELKDCNDKYDMKLQDCALRIWSLSLTNHRTSIHIKVAFIWNWVQQLGNKESTTSKNNFVIWSWFTKDMNKFKQILPRGVGEVWREIFWEPIFRAWLCKEYFIIIIIILENLDNEPYYTFKRKSLKCSCSIEDTNKNIQETYCGFIYLVYTSHMNFWHYFHEYIFIKRRVLLPNLKIDSVCIVNT